MTPPAAAAMVEDDDENAMLAEYDVFITPELEEQIYLLQYPNRIREQPYNERSNAKPQEMRIKPKSGFMELDLSLNIYSNFDKAKGVSWGEGLRMAKESGTNAFGLASGFGKGARTNELFAAERAATVARCGEDDIQRLLRKFDEADTQGHVMNKQTLGGQIIQPEPGGPIYMLGAFRGTQLHLSYVSGMCQMRPQFHHIDAQAQLAKTKAQRERSKEDPPRAAEPRLVQQTARPSGADEEELNIAKTSSFLTAASEEQWIKLNFHDEDSDDAYAAYRDTLFVDESEDTAKLTSLMNNEGYLDAISAPRIEQGSKTRKKPPMTRKQMIDLAEESDGAVEEHRLHSRRSNLRG